MRRNSMLGLRAVVVGVALALLTTACSDDDGGSAETATTTTAASTTTVDDGGSGSEETTTTEATTAEPEPLTASWKGVTEDTVSISVSILDFAALRDAGLQDFGWGDQRLIWEFYLDQLNERGGVAGRQVDYHLEFYLPFALEAETACAQMTEDRDVFAVLGAFLGPAESATPCLSRQEDLVIFGGTMTVELLEGSKAVWVSNGVADRRRIPAFFEELERAGHVEGQKVAVVSGDEDEDNTNNVVIPILDDLGLDVVLSVVNTSSESDVIQEDRFWDITSEQIRAEQAEVIVINGDTTGAIRGIARNGLDQELWVVNSGQLTNLGTTVPDRSVADGALAFGSASAEETWGEPNLAACVKEFTDAHPEIEVQGPLEVAEGAERWDTAIALACGWIAMFETLMNAADPELSPAAIQAAYEGYGDTNLPGQVFGSWGPGKPDANDGFRLSVFDSTVGENGALAPVTDLLDATP